MATLDRILQMQQQGMQDEQISEQLKQEGISPKDITTSMEQAKVKNAVSPTTPETQSQGMQSSITDENIPAPQTTPVAPQEVQTPQTVPEENYNQEQWQGYGQAPQTYDANYYTAPQAGTNTETISEIAEQIVEEKMEKITNEVGKLSKFSKDSKLNLNDLKQRLEKLENTIENLQQAVLGKIGEFGDSNTMIQKDLENIHGTMSKMMNPLIDNYNELKKFNSKK